MDFFRFFFRKPKNDNENNIHLVSLNQYLILSSFKSTSFFLINNGEKGNGDDLFSMSNFVR